MLLGDILIAYGLVEPEDIMKALARQQEMGGRLGENLVALGLLASEELENILHEAPAAPITIADTGIPTNELLRLLIKAILAGSLETPTEISAVLKLPLTVINKLMAEATERRWFEILGTTGNSMLAEQRYSLTEAGRLYAAEAQQQNQYVGPIPVSLEAYTDRIMRQRITNEHISHQAIVEAFSGLVIAEDCIRRLGPGVNAGRSMLLYGPPGNGKTTIAERIAKIFDNVVYVPYCISVDGQIIKIFDPNLHVPAIDDEAAAARPKTLIREEFDGRWVACHRPIIIVGGELTMEMLDLQFNQHAKFYEAPLHIKALSGTFIIDDFGRQIISPKELLNRWIVPLESRVDYLKLHTGKSFAVPFDELVIFSTNMAPSDLMDAAFLRRIPYKLEIGAPSRDDFYKIFQAAAALQKLDLPDEIVDYVIEELQVKNNFELACYQAKFIVDQVVAACKYADLPPQVSRELVHDALENLYTKDTRERSNSLTTVSV
ncbi:MAG: AAA family ATPase [bacterium]|nr:AAA family ATPase [bacterium]